MKVHNFRFRSKEKQTHSFREFLACLLAKRAAILWLHFNLQTSCLRKIKFILCLSTIQSLRNMIGLFDSSRKRTAWKSEMKRNSSVSLWRQNERLTWNKEANKSEPSTKPLTGNKQRSAATASNFLVKAVRHSPEICVLAGPFLRGVSEIARGPERLWCCLHFGCA